jgi:hypothetical protein
MTHPFYRVFIIILLSCTLSQLIFMVLDKGQFKFNCFTNEKLTEMFVKDTDYKLITVGSSRSLSHINPFILDSVLKIPTYNAGIAGANVFEIKTVVYAYLKAHAKAPEYILFNIDRRTLSDLTKYYSNTIYYPYLNNSGIDSMMQEAQIKTYFYKYVPFTQLFEYDDYMRNIGLQGHRNKTEMNKECIYYHGFLSLPKNQVFKLKSKDKLEFDVSVTETGINHLMDMIQLCKAKGIKLIFMFAPELHNKPGEYPANAALATIDSIANIHHFNVLRYDNLDSIYTADKFADKRHLNGKSANLFSLHLANDLAQIIKE